MCGCGLLGGIHVVVIQSEKMTCTVMDVIDKAMPDIIRRYLATLSFKERVRILSQFCVWKGRKGLGGGLLDVNPPSSSTKSSSLS